jgi:hypothetical protein
MIRWLAAAAVVLTVGIGDSQAAEFTYSLPQLLGSPQCEQKLSVDLGGEFTSIASARLIVAGTHTPGLLGDLSPNPQMFPYPASVDAYSPAATFSNSGILGELLSTDPGPFEVNEEFHRVPPGGPPDFTTWLDGTADFFFSAGPSAYIMIYRTIANPVVDITSATLVVNGERPSLVIEPSADYNGDGAVDGDDLAWWQTAFEQGDGDADGAEFLLWQQQLGRGAAAAASTAIPEPHSLALLPAALAALMGSRGWRPRLPLSR